MTQITFGRPVLIKDNVESSLPQVPQLPIVKDFNIDGNVDVVEVVDKGSAQNIQIRLGERNLGGSTMFRYSQKILTGERLEKIEILSTEDADHDGDPDITLLGEYLHAGQTKKKILYLENLTVKK
ncbi:MAG: hypothetical protein HN337_00295 [Deltaproteobacteria bacterium]|jgi:hypothetical protein|nr:hypothetical protein [Deltaproteobacteria bacterium]